MKKALTIAGSDSCGGAGIQADLKTFSALGVYGMSVLTAITAQNTQGVMGVEEISPQMVGMQIDAVFQDIEVDAVKIGMVSNREIIEIIGDKLKAYDVRKAVVDTVMVSKSGCHLLRPEAKEALIKQLIPRAFLVTPNLYEAEVLTGKKIRTIGDMEEAAKIIYVMGPVHVLVKGGHLEGKATDVLYDGKTFTYFEEERIHTPNTHGTGCTFASAIAAHLALGYDLREAVGKSKTYITMAIAHALNIGKGVGPTHHFYQFYPERSI